MPVYDYSCTDPACREVLEDKLVRSHSTTITCTCGEAMIRAGVNQTSFLLKGGGWYKDHYGLKKASGNNSTD